MPGRTARAWTYKVEGTKITIEYPCGHRSTKDYSKGPISKRMGVEGCRMMGRWWRKEAGGVNAGPCKRCEKQIWLPKPKDNV